MKTREFWQNNGFVVLLGVFFVLPSNISQLYADYEVVHDTFEVNFDGWCNLGVDTYLTAVENEGNNGTRGMMVINRSSASDGAYSEKGFYLDVV